MSAARKPRQPWPMKWIAVAILLVIVPYTFLTLRYRKPGQPFRPYQDTQDRANVVRLLSAGYQRITLAAQRPADPIAGVTLAQTADAPAGLPAELTSTLVQPPLLPAAIGKIAAAAGTSSFLAYPIHFSCTLPDDKQQLAGADLYLKDNEVVITPDFERLTGGLLTRTRENVILITVPGGTFKPGQYRVTLTGQQNSRTWSLEVK